METSFNYYDNDEYKYHKMLDLIFNILPNIFKIINLHLNLNINLEPEETCKLVDIILNEEIIYNTIPKPLDIIFVESTFKNENYEILYIFIRLLPLSLQQLLLTEKNKYYTPSGWFSTIQEEEEEEEEEEDEGGFENSSVKLVKTIKNINYLNKIMMKNYNELNQ